MRKRDRTLKLAQEKVRNSGPRCLTLLKQYYKGGKENREGRVVSVGITQLFNLELPDSN